MKKNSQVRLLRISYWVGAIVDALVIIPMLSPRIGGVVFGIADVDPAPGYGYAMHIAASLMGGWVFLLLWADRRPVERKGILILTLFPVLTGLMVSGVYAMNTGLIAAERMLPTWIGQSLLVILFAFSYVNARMRDP